MTTGKPFASYQGSSSLQRPVYSAGLLLEDEDLNVGVEYTRDLMKLMLKSLFGCGVICGLDVDVTPTCEDTKRRVDVSPGIALDGEGSLIEVSKPWSHEFCPDCDEGWPKPLWVVLCYKEKCCRPKDVSCSADGEGQSQQTRVRAGFEIGLWERLPKCVCHCASADDGDDEGDETDDDGGCCGHKAKRKPAKKKVVAAPAGAGTGAGGVAGAAVMGAVSVAVTEEEELCPCYADHFRGVCGCECCKCVVLGRIVTPVEGEDKDKPLVDVDTSMVRRVRPVLNGYLECRFPEKAPRTPVKGERGPSVREPKASRGSGKKVDKTDKG